VLLEDLLVGCDPNRSRCKDDQEIRQAAHAGPSESLKRSLAAAEQWLSAHVRITHQVGPCRPWMPLSILRFCRSKHVQEEDPATQSLFSGSGKGVEPETSKRAPLQSDRVAHVNTGIPGGGRVVARGIHSYY